IRPAWSATRTLARQTQSPRVMVGSAVRSGRPPGSNSTGKNGMFKLLFAAAGLWCGSAFAEATPSQAPAPDGAPMMGGKGPVDTVEEKVEEKKSADELEREARMAEIEEANKQKA